MIQVRDVTVTSLPIRLHIKMETIDGRGIETVPNIIVMPTYVGGGETTIFFGEDLAPYFNPDNLVFKGYTKEQYRRTGQLPEGFYRVTVEVRHSMTGRLISNRGTAMGWFALGKPPLLKLPATDVELGQIAGIPLTFTWETSNIGIPGANVQYTFELWELRLDGINPNAIVTTMPPYHTTTQFHNTLVVHPSILNLEPGMRYAWRVTASDLMNQVPFEQDGHSEVRIFTYMCKCDTTRNLKVEQKSKDAIYSWSTADRHTSFTIEAENITTGYNRRDIVYDNKYKLQGLNYDQEYRLRVQAVCDGNTQYPSEFSAWKKFKLTPPPTPEEICPECECKAPLASEPVPENKTLKMDLNVGDTITTPSGNNIFIITSITQSANGIYKGQFHFWVKIWGVKFLCDFWDLRVNTDKQILEYDFLSVNDPSLLIDVDAITEDIEAITNALKPNDTVSVNFTVSDTSAFNIDCSADSVCTVTVTGDNGETETITLPKDSIGNVTSVPIIVTDDDGNVYEIKDDNGKLVTERVSEKDKSSIHKLSSCNFLYVTVDGRQDTIYDNHTLYLPKQDASINLRIGYDLVALAHCARQNAIKDDNYRSRLRLKSGAFGRIIPIATKWTWGSNDVLRPDFEISRSMMNGNVKMKVDTRVATNIIFYDTITRRDTVIIGDSIPGSEIEFTINFIDGSLLSFKPIDDHYRYYGFDDALVPQCQAAGDYGQPLRVANTDYYVPMMYLLPNNEVSVKIQYQSSNAQLDSMIVFECDDAKLSINEKEKISEIRTNVNTLLLEAKQGDTATYILKAYALLKGGIKTSEIGRLMIQSRPLKEPKEVRIIRVRRSDEADYYAFSTSEKRALVESLNLYYKQCFLQFRLADSGTYVDTFGINKSTNQQIEDLNEDLYKNFPNKVVNKYFIFVCSPSTNSDITGMGLLLNNCAIVYNKSGIVAAHEIGHNLGLLHTFEQNYDDEAGVCRVENRIIPKHTTKNIMDYIGFGSDMRRYFLKYQIDYLKNK
jgi:hypothetical protein